MNYRVNRTLFDDLLKAYYSTYCESDIIDWDYNCNYCKHKVICETARKLIKSIKKFYKR